MNVRVHSLAALALLIASTSTVLAAPIRTLPGLTSVTIYEETFSTVPTTYAANSVQLTTRQAGDLTIAFDFSFFPGENYDAFYSDANGAFNIDGAFLTIEGIWRNYGIPFGGMNINEVQLDFVSLPSDYADYVASFATGSICSSFIADCIAGSELSAVDHNLVSFPRFGHTDSNSERFRLTLGFNGISNVVTTDVPEPVSITVFGAGLVGAAALRRRRKHSTESRS